MQKSETLFIKLYDTVLNDDLLVQVLRMFVAKPYETRSSFYLAEVLAELNMYIHIYTRGPRQSCTDDRQIH